MTDPRIFHITDPVIWVRARAAGEYVESTRDATLADVGFVHCSFWDQVETVANFVYDDWPDSLLLLEIDVARLDSPSRVENLDGGTVEFPHVYGPIPLRAVVATHELARRDGRWTLPVSG